MWAWFSAGCHVLWWRGCEWVDAPWRHICVRCGVLFGVGNVVFECLYVGGVEKCGGPGSVQSRSPWLGVIV